MTITDFVYSIKARSDELAVLGAPLDADDLTEYILDGLDEDYTELVRAVQAREAAISFDELHEKLLLFEASLQTRSHPSRLGPVLLILLPNSHTTIIGALQEPTGAHLLFLLGTILVPPPRCQL
uniref:Uncharacterized protein n=1 Tax=Populus alba TaxID=43335 RepID=A0A4V6A9E3_POPAL|nr:hypothetical protein D5086_0000131830 [Populus alba]